MHENKNWKKSPDIFISSLISEGTFECSNDAKSGDIHKTTFKTEKAFFLGERLPKWHTPNLTYAKKAFISIGYVMTK